ncbi:hypothetical protein [Bartonella grahamii]|uniref:hypothetical protein n=1 Tax=Bartonella grahamii TaxID=33045 RepID=UPI002E7BAF67|nr:hypothetical protein [Bartonella grahamii]
MSVLKVVKANERDGKDKMAIGFYVSFKMNDGFFETSQTGVNIFTLIEHIKAGTVHMVLICSNLYLKHIAMLGAGVDLQVIEKVKAW